MVALRNDPDDDTPNGHSHTVTDPAVMHFRQAISILQGCHHDAPIVRDQAAILMELCKPRRKEVIKGKPTVHPPWMQLAMSLDCDEVSMNIRISRGRWITAAVNQVHTERGY